MLFFCNTSYNTDRSISSLILSWDINLITVCMKVFNMNVILCYWAVYGLNTVMNLTHNIMVPESFVVGRGDTTYISTLCSCESFVCSIPHWLKLCNLSSFKSIYLKISTMISEKIWYIWSTLMGIFIRKRIQVFVERKCSKYWSWTWIGLYQCSSRSMQNCRKGVTLNYEAASSLNTTKLAVDTMEID